MRIVIQKQLRKIKRLFLASAFLGLALVVSFGEIYFLSNKKDSPINALANDNVIVGSDNKDSEKNDFVVNSDVVGADARPMLIKNYLERYDSPLAPYSDLIFQVSNDYGFDYYWIVAIAQQESNLCKKAPEGSHNCWGYGIHKKGSLGFDNYELAIRSYAEYLKREYFDKGLNTPELIMKKYCPSSNGSWAAGVNQFINEMKTGDF